MDAKRVKFAVLVIVFLSLLALAVVIIRPFITTLLASFVFAYLFNPVYKFIDRRIKRPTVSALIVTVATTIILVVPLVLIANVIINEAVELYRLNVYGQITDIAAALFADVPIIAGSATTMVQKGVSYAVSFATNFLVSVPEKILHLVIFLYAFFYLLISGELFIGKIRAAIPLRNKDKLLQHLGDTTYAMVYGLFLVALLEFVIAAIGLSIFRVSVPFLWALLIFLAALLPLIGPSAVLVPLMVYKLLQGEVFALVGVVIVWVLLLYVDTLTRAKILSDRAKMHPVVMLLGIIGGLSVFGLMGIILGPLVLSFVLVIIEDYYYELVRE